MKKVIKDIHWNLMFVMLKNCMNFIMTFLLERMKIVKTGKLIAILHDKTEYVIHRINLKQALNHGLILQKVHRVIKYSQNGLIENIYLYEHRFTKRSQKRF